MRRSALLEALLWLAAIGGLLVAARRPSLPDREPPPGHPVRANLEEVSLRAADDGWDAAVRLERLAFAPVLAAWGAGLTGSGLWADADLAEGARASVRADRVSLSGSGLRLSGRVQVVVTPRPGRAEGPRRLAADAATLGAGRLFVAGRFRLDAGQGGAWLHGRGLDADLSLSSFRIATRTGAEEVQPGQR